MHFDEYQKESRKTAIYPNQGDDFVYPTLGLVGEAGEVADKFKKLIRDHGIHTPSKLSDEQKDDLVKELGDVLWYLSQLSTELGVSLSEVAEKNLEKLSSRKERNVLGGSGDNR